jgi:tetratricopeptide (TPR) repeat protein
MVFHTEANMDKQPAATKEWLIYGSMGMLISLCFVLIAAGILFRNEVVHTVLPTATPASSSTPLPTETPSPTSTSTPPPVGPTLDAREIIGQAYKMLENNDIQGAIDLLEANLAEITENTQKVLAVQTLGDLYAYQGSYQIAAAYYEQLYELEPNAFGLFLIATAYDAGGNLNKAQEYYLRCLNLHDPDFPEEQYQVAVERSDQLTVILTGSTLTPIPTGTPE